MVDGYFAELLCNTCGEMPFWLHLPLLMVLSFSKSNVFVLYFSVLTNGVYTPSFRVIFSVAVSIYIPPSNYSKSSYSNNMYTHEMKLSSISFPF